jgi:hypothetical protein
MKVFCDAYLVRTLRRLAQERINEEKSESGKACAT